MYPTPLLFAGENKPCTCPSGDGSLRWPCPQHPAAIADQMTDAMIDTETLGTRPGSAILSIGAVMFGPAGLGETFYAPISLSSCVDAGLTICSGTVAWWMRQSDEARAAAFPTDAAPLREVLLDFYHWIRRQKAKHPWCHGATFDVPLLDAAFKACGLDSPWEYYNVRDTRTLYDLAGVKVDRAAGTHHNALDDAKAQAEAAVKAFATLRERRAMPAAMVRTWRERISVSVDFPLHAPTDVERAMEAEIAELRARIGAQEGEPGRELTPKWEGEFKSFEDWVSRAQRALASPSHRPAICVDAKGRRCFIGKDFMLARDEDAFPVRYFWECERADPSTTIRAAQPSPDVKD